MANKSTRIKAIPFLVTVSLISVLVVDASVTWRQVRKPTLKQNESTTESTTKPLAKHNTKSPVTWKRSTISRRSTDAAESRINEDSSDELDEASSSQEEHLTEQEADLEIKPLLPGSRPGFWFDSSRKKKPSSLLRPGTRRNSLFPTRSSTTTTSSPTTVAVTALTPRTPPSVANFGSKATNSRNFRLNRTTKYPIAFKRRIKTTKVPKKTSTEYPAVLENKNPDSDVENETETEDKTDEEDSEFKEVTRNSKEIETEIEDLKTESPKLSIRRRPFNSTRLSWTRQNDRKSSRTTAIPQQVTTTYSTTKSVSKQANGRFSQKTTVFPGTRSRSRFKTTEASDSSWSKTRLTTPTSPTKSSIDDQSLTRNVLKSSSKSKKDSASNLNNEDDDNSTIETSTQSINDFEIRQDLPKRNKPKVKTTVEPYYITRDYGRIATAIPELSFNNGHIINSSEKSVEDELITTVTPNITSENYYVQPTEPKTRKRKKKIRVKVTEAPKVTTTEKESLQDADLDYEYDSEDLDTLQPDVDNFPSRNSTKINLLTTEENGEIFSEKEVLDNRTTTTRRPVTFGAFSTIDPKSNAYVVWSLGHGGSGWSYQKHGGQVKWSAQNSEADGDNWSVIGKEDDDEFEKRLKHQWMPLRNSTTVQNLEKISKMKEDKQVSTRIKIAEPEQSIPSVSYTPTTSFKNETVLNFKIPDDSSISFTKTNITSFVLSSSPADYFDVKPKPSDNLTTLEDPLSQAFIRESNPTSYVSQTPMPNYPTLENEFNEQVQGIINQYPIVANYPYMAEIRETNKNFSNTIVTDPPRTGYFDVQNYASENLSEKDNTIYPPIHQLEQIFQGPQSYPYPTNLPQTGSEIDFPGNSDKAILTPEQSISISTPRPKYSSGIPPELAKAVVNAKKWRVIGNGGDEGWSLLNEDGILEWKIHNVDGQWRVSSAEQLKEMQATKLQIEDGVSGDNTNAESFGYSNQDNSQDLPKIWTLEDDYEKWRAVSRERGTPADDTSAETSKSSQESVYDSQEYYSDYYSEEDYYNSEPVNENITPYNPNNDYGSRPLWEDGKNRPTYNQAKESYPQFAQNIEVANSREDAIAAWKSLIIDQGHWKFAETTNDAVRAYPQLKISTAQNYDKYTNRRVSKIPEEPQDTHINHNKNQETIVGKYEPFRGNTNGQHVNVKRDQFEETKFSNREHVNRRYQPEGINMSSNENVGQKQSQIIENQRNIKYETSNSPEIRYQTNYWKENSKANDSIYESLTESHVQNYKYRDNDYGKISHHTGRNEDRVRQESNNFLKTNSESHRYRPNNVNQAHVAQIPTNLQVNDQVKSSFQRGVYESDTKSNNEQYENTGKENLNSNIQRFDSDREVLNDRNAETPFEPRIRIKGKNHSKLESLISKLEAIQKETQGRAIIDLTDLIRNLQSRRNTSTASSQSTETESNQSLRRIAHYPNTQTKHNVEKTANNKFSERKHESQYQQNDENLQRDWHKDSETELTADTHGKLSYRNDYINNNEKVRLEDHRYTNSGGTAINNFSERKHEIQYQRNEEGLQREWHRDSETELPTDTREKLSYRNDFNNYEKIRLEDNRNTNSDISNNVNQEKHFNQRQFNRSREIRPSNQNVLHSQNPRIYPPARTTQQYRHEKFVATNKPRNNFVKSEKHATPQNTYSRNLKTSGSTDKNYGPYSSSSEEVIVDLKDTKRNSSVGPRRHRRPSRKRSRRPQQPQPIVLKGETEIEDEEDGSLKNRKIIVIDYAGAQRKKSSVDKKDLELIIRNVKHRRSGIYEKDSESVQ